MRHILISVFFIFLIAFVSAINISIKYPNSVFVNEEFQVNVYSDSNEKDIHDIKIYVNNNENKTISQIFDESTNSWKNSRYYINQVYPSQDSFKLRVMNFSNQASLCIKLRKENKYIEKCDRLIINNFTTQNDNIKLILTSPKKEYISSELRLEKIMTLSFIILVIIILILLILKKI